MTQTKRSTTRILVECALMVALASVLCVFPKFKFLAFGGSITFCSMLPIVLVSYRNGIKWGLLSGLVFALIQMLTGFSSVGYSVFAVAMVVLLDYLLPFTLLGLGGMFRGRFGKPAPELALGTLVVLLTRYACHIISGYVVWGEYADTFFANDMGGSAGSWFLTHFSGHGLALVYSVVYNGLYMIPEIIITVIVAVLIAKWAVYGLPPDTKDSAPAA